MELSYRYIVPSSLVPQTSKTRDRIDSLKAEKARLSQLLSDLSLSRGPSNQHRWVLLSKNNLAPEFQVVISFYGRDTYIKMEEYERRLRAVCELGYVKCLCCFHLSFANLAQADEAYNKAREDVVRTSVAMEDCRTCLTKLLAKFPKDEVMPRPLIDSRSRGIPVSCVGGRVR